MVRTEPIGTDVFVARVNVDGTIDTTFGTNGFRIFQGGTDNRPTNIITDTNDDIYLGCTFNIGTSSLVTKLVKLTSEGEEIMSFGSSGSVNTGGSRANGIVINNDNKIIVGSGFISTSISRVNSDGSPDNTFRDGWFLVSFDLASGSHGGANAVQIQSDNKILVSASVDNSTNIFDTDAEMSILRLIPSEALSVDENELENEISFYPNPITNDRLHINFATIKNKEVQISFYDLTNKLIFRKKENTGNGFLEIGLPNLKSGLYILNLKTDGHFINKKIIISN
ncbi:MAG: hypothetical protein ACI87N_002557 [Flavobacteriales bacterium]|jgi:hypothetical protein